MVTLQDVARRAGVSPAAASAVLNSSQISARTSAATRERIIKAAAELAYRPNAVARSLRSQSMATIGFYHGFGRFDSRNAFIVSIMAGMHERCDEVGCDLLLHRRTIAGDTLNRFREIASGKVDGVILYTYENDPLVDLLVEHRFPCVALADAHPKVPSYVADDEAGSTLLARRLADRGHRRAIYRLPPSPRASANHRCHAFCAEAESLGIHVQVTESNDMHGEVSEAEAAILDCAKPACPTAIGNWNDLSAIQVFTFLQRAGRASEFDIVGFDGFDRSGVGPDITTIRVPWEAIAASAVDGVRSLLAGQTVPLITTLPGELIQGATG